MNALRALAARRDRRWGLFGRQGTPLTRQYHGAGCMGNGRGSRRSCHALDYASSGSDRPGGEFLRRSGSQLSRIRAAPRSIGTSGETEPRERHLMLPAEKPSIDLLAGRRRSKEGIRFT